MEPPTKKARRQPLTLTEETKDWHGVWTEVTFRPKGTEIADVATFESIAKNRIRNLLHDRFRKSGPMKIIGFLELGMKASDRDGIFLHGFSSGSKKRDTGRPILLEGDIDSAVDTLFAKLNADVTEYEGRGSGWTIYTANHFTLKVTPYKAFRGRGWIDLPEWVRAKKAVINIKNTDARCFLYALTLATNFNTITAHRDRPKNYEAFFDKLKMVDVEYPVSADQIPGIEASNTLSINVFGLNLETAKGPSDIVPEYRASTAFGTPINLLRIYNEEDCHYCYITNMDGLLREGTTEKNFCSLCWQTFSDKAILAEHTAKGKCTESSDEALRELPSKDKAFVRFTQIEKQLRVPFAVYLAMDTAETDGVIGATKVCVKVISDYANLYGCTYKEFEGPSCVPEFLAWLIKRESYALEVLKRNVPFNGTGKLTDAEETSFQAARQCYICEEQLQPPPNRHRDHDHLNGNYRGAACPGCNVNLHHKRFLLPIFCHGLKEREAHLLIKHMDADKRELRCLPQTVEKMLSLTWGRCRFVDTRAFMDADLPVLVQSLEAADPSALKLAEGCTATKKTVHELACVFEAFRKHALKDIGLDPAHFVGVPGLAWTAFLRKTKAQIGCFSEGEDDMLDFVQSAIRGGVSIIRKRLAVANNPIVPGYDQSKTTSWLQYLDCNSLYPTAMLHKLPIGEFEWLELDDFKMEAVLLWDIEAWTPDNDYGYFAQVDVEYPESLHEAHNDLPFLPEKRAFEPSPAMSAVAERLGLSRALASKLVPNLCKKTEMVVHVSELQQAMKHGLVVTKIHKALKFKQVAFMRPWIDFCVEKRRAAASDFERDFWKLMMNSVFGKTCEQVQNRVDVKFLKQDSSERLEHFTNRPQFNDGHIITPNLLQIELGKCRVKYDKPLAVGAAILGIGKVLLADFWYGCIKAKYPQAELCMSDTDSLLFYAETPDLYSEMVGDKRYDTSNYPKDHPLFNAEQAKVPGYFKDETGGRAIAEFVGLRPKMYSVLMADGGPTKVAAGGLVLTEAVKLDHQDYRDALTATAVHSVEFEQIQSHLHVMSTKTVRRVGLCAYDDKAWVCDDGIHTLAHGHFQISK